MNKKDLSAYMSKIGTVGGKKSRRTLSPKEARAMQKLSLESKRSKRPQKDKKISGK